MKKPSAIVALTVAVCSLWFIANQPSQAAPGPQTMQYQGKLTDSAGRPIDGARNLTFRLFSAVAPLDTSTFIWGEVHENVPVRRGIFTIQLGEGTLTIDGSGTVSGGSNTLTSADLDGPRWIQVQVNGDAPLAPPARLGAVPFAVSACGVVPVGGVVDWYRADTTTSVPDGWVICNGDPISDPDSPFNGQNSPDLVNRFVRGLDPSLSSSYGGGSLPDSGGQNSVNLSHGHTVGSHSHSIAGHTHGLGNHTHPMTHTHSVTGPTSPADQNGTFPPSPFTYQGGFFAHRHQVGLTTSGASSAQTGGASGTSGPSNSSSTGTAAPGTTASLGVVEILPAYVGMLKIMRIR